MSDELDMELDRILRTAVTAAGQVAERAARLRANQDRLAAEQEATRRRALEQAHKEELQAAPTGTVLLTAQLRSRRLHDERGGRAGR